MVAVSMGRKLKMKKHRKMASLFVALTIAMMGVMPALAADSASVSLTATVLPLVISISVAPTSVEFGSIVQGHGSEGKTVIITSASTVSIDLSVSVTEVGSFYADNLGLGDAVVTDWSGVIFVDGDGDSLEVYLYLQVPIDAPTGLQEGTLVFWAEKFVPT